VKGIAYFTGTQVTKKAGVNYADKVLLELQISRDQAKRKWKDKLLPKRKLLFPVLEMHCE